MKNYKQLYQQSQLENGGFIDREYASMNPVKGLSSSTQDYRNLLIQRDISINSNKYIWKNLPFNLTSTQLESFFYIYGSLCFFQNNNNLLVGTYSKSGELTPFGNLSKIIPIDFSGHSYETVYDVISPNGQNTINTKTCAVVINDSTSTNFSCYSKYDLNSKTTISDQIIGFQLMKNNLVISIKKAIIVCDNEEQKNQMEKQLAMILDIDSPILSVAKTKNNKVLEDVSLFNLNTNTDYQGYMQLIEYYDKIRLAYSGLPTPSPFAKRERMIVDEAKQENIDTKFVLQDGLNNRQNGLNLMKQYFNNKNIQKITVELNETLVETREEENANIE